MDTPEEAHMFDRVRQLAGRGACAIALLVVSLLPAVAQGPGEANLTIVALDPDARTIAGARVLVTTPAGVVGEATTNAEGEAAVPGLPAARYRVQVFADGFRAEPAEVDLSPGLPVRVTVSLTLSALSDTVVVSASRVEAPLSTLATSATVISATDLETRQIETVADALRSVPGFAIASNGGRGTVTSVFPRGGESDFTLVLIDGIRQNDFGGGFDFGHLSVAGVERVEVVRGAQSALHGSDAIGGVVQIVTRRGGTPQWQGLAEGGSFGTSRLAASTAGSTAGLSWGAAVERAASRGFEGIAPATGETVSNDDYRRTEVSGTAAYRHRVHDLRLSAREARYDRGYPGAFGRDPNGTFGGVDRVSRGESTRRSVGGAWTFTPSVDTRLRAGGGWSRFDNEFVSAFGRSSSGTRRTDGRVQGDMALGRAIGISAGVDVLGEEGSSSFIAADGRAVQPLSRSLVGTFGEARIDLGRVSLVAGLRVERLHRDALPGDTSPFVDRPSFEAQTVVSTNPKLAASWLVRSPGDRGAGWTRLRASAGTGIRPPTAFEMAFTDNPALRPERSRSLDIGIEQGWRGGAVIAEVIGFANEYDDLIVAIGRSFANASQFRTDNVANARARGAETSVHVRVASGLRVSGTYTWLDSRVLSVDGVPGAAPSPFAVNDWLIRRPRHAGQVDVTLARMRWNAFVSVGARGRVLDVDPSFGAFGGKLFAPGYWTTDAGASWRVGRLAEVFGRITNLLDGDYESALGFPALGRAAMVGVRVARGR